MHFIQFQWTWKLQKWENQTKINSFYRSESEIEMFSIEKQENDTFNL